MVKKAGHALVVGAAAIYVSEQVVKSAMYTNATDANTQLVYKYGGAMIGALAAGFAWHAVMGGE